MNIKKPYKKNQEKKIHECFCSITGQGVIGQNVMDVVHISLPYSVVCEPRNERMLAWKSAWKMKQHH